EGEAELADELLVALHALRADRQHLCAQSFELRDVGRVLPQLLRAHGRVVARIEDEQHRVAAFLRQRVAATAGARQREVGGRVPHTRCGHYASTSSRMASGMSKLA